MQNLYKTDHASIRTSQRGISDQKLYLVVNNVEPKPHKGNLIYYIKNKDLRSMLNRGNINKQEVDKLRNLVVVTDEKENKIITAYFASQAKSKKILNYY